MGKTKAKKNSIQRRVTFSLSAPTAKEVSLGGNFNNWDLAAHPMKKDANGVWKKTLVLAPGRYDYKFLVDNRWENDPKNDKTCPNSFGTQNNVIKV
jgi:1,4-alpha-glucan branching enzyme